MLLYICKIYLMDMKNKISGVAVLPLLVVSSAQDAEHQNVAYIMTDQQCYYMVSAITNNLDLSSPYVNNNYFKTPNLDKLVKNCNKNNSKINIYV